MEEPKILKTKPKGHLLYKSKWIFFFLGNQNGSILAHSKIKTPNGSIYEPKKKKKKKESI
jgi:hypothetical protein